MRTRSLFASTLVIALFATGCSTAGSEQTATLPSTTTTAAPTTVSTAPPTTAAPTTTQPAVIEEPLEDFKWVQQTPAAPWAKRAGLRVVELEGQILMMGGRTPNQSTIPGDSQIWADVWASDDLGRSWSQLADGADMWAPRAYFQLVTKDDAIFVMGGQDYGLEKNPFCELLESGVEPPPGLGIDPDAPCPEFFPTSRFFNDVWSSTDGIEWEQLTASAPWSARAGLSAEVYDDHIYVMGGSQNDDSSIIGAGGPQREYFNDVWRSSDGVEWELMTDAAPWEPRAGGVVVTREDGLYLLGGEDGFTCEPLPDCEAPYFNDVWRTTNGADWELVTNDAAWSPRPGHICELVGDDFVCFGGFGLTENPMDIWASADGADWQSLEAIPWDATTPQQMRYDFDGLSIAGPNGPMILTFGGDRETFDFADPDNYTRVDNDVWAFSLPPN